MLRKILTRFKKKEAKWDILPTDTFLVSYPRSGNTWMRYLLANLFEPSEVWHIDNIGQIVPDIHQPPPKTFYSPRIIKSHLPYQTAYQNVIYLYRDGRDVALSYYDYLTKVRDYSEPFDTFFSTYLTNGFGYGTWHAHVESVQKHQYKIKLLPIKYEQLVRVTMPELEKVADFLGVSWSTEAIKTAIRRSSIDNLRKDYRERKFETHWKKGFTGGIQAGIGKWRDRLTADQKAAFWEVAGGITEQLDYERD